MFRFFLFFLLSPLPLFCQPSWLLPPSSSSVLQSPPPPEAVQPPGGGGVVSKPRVVYRDRVVESVRVDTVFFVDTVRIVDTLHYRSSQYKYIVRYALTSLNVELANPEWLDYASVSEIVARDTATLRVGSEEIRTIGSIIDQFGNKVPQQDIITAGFTIQIMKDRVMIEYRGKSSVAYFSGSFDPYGFLFATGEISESNFFASFFPFSLFFNSAKKRIIIEIFREVIQ